MAAKINTFNSLGFGDMNDLLESPKYLDGSEFKHTPEPETVSMPDTKFMKSLEDALGAERLNSFMKTETGIASQFSSLSLTPSPASLSELYQNALESPATRMTPKSQRLSIGLTPKERRESLGFTPKERRLSTRSSFTGIESELSNISDSRILRTLSNLSACSTSSGMGVFNVAYPSDSPHKDIESESSAPAEDIKVPTDTPSGGDASTSARTAEPSISTEQPLNPQVARKFSFPAVASSWQRPLSNAPIAILPSQAASNATLLAPYQMEAQHQAHLSAQTTSNAWSKTGRPKTIKRTLSKPEMKSFKKSKRAARKVWSKEEDQRLRDAVKQVGGASNWRKIAAIVGTRSANKCAQRWRKSLRPELANVVKGTWTEAEDMKLRQIVNKFGSKGTGVWEQIAIGMSWRRNPKQCRERWQNFLDPSLRLGKWTPAEDSHLMSLFKLYGPKWAEIAGHLPGRTNDRVKKRYKFLMRERQQWA